MEKRAILAAVLMAALLIIYQVYFFPSSSESPAPPPKPAAEAPPAPAVPPAPAPSPAVRPEPPRETPRLPQRTASIESPLYRAVVSSEGGKLQDWTLKYRGEKPVISIGEFGPLGLLVGSQQNASSEPVSMRLSTEALKLGPAQPAEALVLSGEADGLRVSQTLRFAADAYTIDALIRIENPTASPRTVTVALPWVFRKHEKMPGERFTGQQPTEVVWAGEGHVERVEDLSAVGNHVVDGHWITIGSTWYLAALIPKSPGFKLVAAGEPKRPDAKNGFAEARIAVRAAPTIAPGQAWEGRVLLFIGPKEYERLQALGLEGTLNFGGFPVPRRFGGLPMEWLGVPILQLMNWVYRYVGNYGIAIILLTVLSKVLFYPLTVKSMRSMKAMQTLQPQINALRNKYKSDPRKLQEETMVLYRQHKVNPMGGCLPMVAQVPVFYALYLALSVSVELQSAAFLCVGRVPPSVPWLGGQGVWICDLAHPDPTYVLPLLMGVTMFVQQKMTPTGGDPRQQKMMLIMPFIFTWMFLGLASGLVLYWTVSNILQILQQWWMDRGRARESKNAARA